MTSDVGQDVTINPARGWAVAFGGGSVIRDIDIRTVSPTRRAAIVNWLYLHVGFVSNSVSDDRIEEVWLNYVKANGGIAVVQVSVESDDD